MPLPAALVAFSPGTVVKSAEVNQNFTALRDNLSNFVVYTDVPRTITVKHVIQLVGPQLQIGVDGSNFFTVNVGATGLVTLDAVGAGAGFTFSDAVTIALGTITTDLKAVDISATWNAGAVTFNALKINVTDTASAAASLLIDLQVGGVSKFKVDKSGAGTFAGALSEAGRRIASRVGSVNTDAGTGAATAETTLHTVNVPANTLGANGMLRITVLFTISGTAGARTLKVKYGGTTFLSRAIGTTTTWVGGVAIVVVANRNSTNSQVGTGHITSSGTSVGGDAFGPVVSTGVVNTTLGQDVIVTGETFDAADEITVHVTTVELIPS